MPSKRAAASTRTTLLPLSQLLKVSRTRFWMYVFGPYIVGLVAGASRLETLENWPILLWGLYFLLPANLLIYGVNDVFDYETDLRNAKKRGYEAPLAPQNRRALWFSIALTNVPFLFALPFLPRFALISLLAFWFFSLGYSVPPIRAKTKPILDAAFNVLYILPGAMAYFLVGGQNFSPQLFLAAWCWAMAMHAYSAVPDISADRAANLKTVATFLGFRGTIFLCGLLYAASAALAIQTLVWLAAALGAVYMALMRRSFRVGTEERVLEIYKFFPFINTLAGGLIFWAIAFSKFVQMR
jgi:4-hydroxybenzoate polyprenyltransferase